MLVGLGLLCVAVPSGRAAAGHRDPGMPKGAGETSVEAPKDKAVVYVFRASASGAGDFPTFYVNGDSVGSAQGAI